MFVIQGQKVGLCQPPYWILAPCWQRIYSPDRRARRGLAASLLSVCGQDESTPGLSRPILAASRIPEPRGPAEAGAGH